MDTAVICQVYSNLMVCLCSFFVSSILLMESPLKLCLALSTTPRSGLANYVNRYILFLALRFAAGNLKWHKTCERFAIFCAKLFLE
jgi:hypothetical protein